MGPVVPPARCGPLECKGVAGGELRAHRLALNDRFCGDVFVAGTRGLPKDLDYRSFGGSHATLVHSALHCHAVLDGVGRNAFQQGACRWQALAALDRQDGAEGQRPDAAAGPDRPDHHGSGRRASGKPARTDAAQYAGGARRLIEDDLGAGQEIVCCCRPLRKPGPVTTGRSHGSALRRRLLALRFAGTTWRRRMGKALLPLRLPSPVRIIYGKGGQSGALPTLRTCVGSDPRHYVTHLPGCNSLATSVSTLTTGSHATIFFALSPTGFAAGCAGARLRTSFTGMRTSTEVSARLSTLSSTVRAGSAACGTLASRSPLAVRLTPAAPAGSPSASKRSASVGLEAAAPAPICTAPSTTTAASAPKMAGDFRWDFCDMSVCPS